MIEFKGNMPIADRIIVGVDPYTSVTDAETLACCSKARGARILALPALYMGDGLTSWAETSKLADEKDVDWLAVLAPEDMGSRRATEQLAQHFPSDKVARPSGIILPRSTNPHYIQIVQEQSGGSAVFGRVLDAADAARTRGLGLTGAVVPAERLACDEVRQSLGGLFVVASGVDPDRKLTEEAEDGIQRECPTSPLAAIRNGASAVIIQASSIVTQEPGGGVTGYDMLDDIMEWIEVGLNTPNPLSD